MRHHLHGAAVIGGMAIADYERHTLGATLVLDPDQAPPTWSHLCSPRHGAPRTENMARLALAVGSVAWTAAHLLRPWVRQLRTER